MRTGTSSSRQGIERLRKSIKVVVILVLLGYLFLWVMLSTNTYRTKWQPQLRAKTNTTFFGKQGANLLVFTFPVLLTASLGCVYLHLGKKLSGNAEGKSKKSRLAAWKRPALVKGPLGIVSRIELAFFVMFIVLLVWSLSMYLKNGFARITPMSAANHGQKVWEARWEDAGLRLGLVGNIALSFLFFPVTRGSSILRLFGLTSEASVKYHIWLGHIVMAIFTVHGLTYITCWIATDRVNQMIKWQKLETSNLAGELALLAGLGLWATTFGRIRRKLFEVFFFTHHLYILFMVFFILHVSVSYASIMLPGFYLFLVDRYLRFLQSRGNVRLVSARVLPCETFELNFCKSRGLDYRPESIAFINVPSISKLQWHPFTVSSSSSLEPDRLSVVIKTEGSWSKKLYQMLSSPSGLDRLQVSFEGPYGPSSTHFLRHDTLVMVSGGSGITPFMSIIRELIFISQTTQSKTPKILLICAFKNSSSLTMLDLLLPLTNTPSNFSNLQLQIEAYVTRDTEPATHNSKVRTIWFKPSPSDAPISSILGPNSWLCLGLVISSSFIMYLFLMGLITHFYIYPRTTFPNSARVALHVLLTCISIAISGSVAFLWNKNQNATDTKQIQNMETDSQEASPESSEYNSERELESLPYQSLSQATNVHYGKRPDLKKLILECKGSSIKVLASGPKRLRHEVATICSSTPADNLYFESISFS
ncbi:Ferric reductase, NAD binding domain, partial [Dillenia turbinata]